MHAQSHARTHARARSPCSIIGAGYGSLAIAPAPRSSGGDGGPSTVGTGNTAFLALLASVPTDPADQLPLQPILTLVCVRACVSVCVDEYTCSTTV